MLKTAIKHMDQIHGGKMRMHMSVSIFLFAFVLSTLAASRQPAFAEFYCRNQSAYCASYNAKLRAYQREREAELKKKHRQEAAQKKQMQDELAWDKANKAKAAEPGTTTQKCWLKNGQLICN